MGTWRHTRKSSPSRDILRKDEPPPAQTTLLFLCASAQVPCNPARVFASLLWLAGRGNVLNRHIILDHSGKRTVASNEHMCLWSAG